MEAAYNRLVSSDSSKVEIFEEIEAQVQRNAKSKHGKFDEMELSQRYAYNVMQSPDRSKMNRKPELIINTEEFLKTPVSNRANTGAQVLYSGKGSGAVYSNRRNRFWNDNSASGVRPALKNTHSPVKGSLIGQQVYNSSKNYDPEFVAKVESFKHEIEEFKADLDTYLSSPKKT